MVRTGSRRRIETAQNNVPRFRDVPDARTVLIADDDPLVLTTFQKVLEGAGYRVLAAKNGRDAFRTLARNAVECVVLDIFMPDQDGIETLREIKATFPNTRVVAMSGGGVRSRFDFLNAAVQFGADGILRKPATGDEILALIKSPECLDQALH